MNRVKHHSRSKKLQQSPPVTPKSKIPLMTGQVELILHTRLAQSLVNDSGEQKRIGLCQFGKKLRELWHCYKQDDPYAYWYFIKIDQMVESIRHKFSEIEQHYTQILSGIRGIKTEIFYSPQPKVYPLPHNTPFFHRTVLLLADMDYILRQSHTIKQLGIVVEAEKLPIVALIPTMRKLFLLPFHWKHTDVTRQDIAQENERGKMAEEKMGKLPKPIFDKQIKSIYFS